MKEQLEWISLGDEGVVWFERQLSRLAELVVASTDGVGEPTIEFRWSTRIAKEMLDSQLTRSGVVSVVAPMGYSSDALIDLTTEMRSASKMAALHRVLGEVRKASGNDSPAFCLMPSNYLFASSEMTRQIEMHAPPELKICISGESVYGLLSLSHLADRLQVFEAYVADFAVAPPIMGFTGDTQFDTICEGIWLSRSVSELQLTELAFATTRVLVKGHASGTYIVWESDEEASEIR